MENNDTGTCSIYWRDSVEGTKIHPCNNVQNRPITCHCLYFTTEIFDLQGLGNPDITTEYRRKRHQSNERTRGVGDKVWKSVRILDTGVG